MAARDAPSEEGGIDWRRLAADRNVSHEVARALWDHAHATAPGDPAQAEHAFHLMLEEAEAASATHEPGRGTLVDGAGARDVSSLGPGKWTRVLLEKPKSAGAARRGAAQAAQAPGKHGTEPGKLSAEALRDKLVAAGQAAKNAADLLAASDPATIVAALLELRAREPGVLQKIMSVAGGAIERVLGHQLQKDPSDPAAADLAATASAAAANAPAADAPATDAPAANPAPASTATTPTPAANTAPASTASTPTPAANTAPASTATTPTPAANTAPASTATAPTNTPAAPAAGNRPAAGAPAPGPAKPTPPSRSSRS